MFLLNYYRIGQRIREFRKLNNLSQEQLAERVNISTTHMSHIETGNTKLSLPVFVNIAETLGVTTDELLGSKNTNTKEDSMKQIDSILHQCSLQEIKILTDIVRSAKESIRKNLNY